VTVDCLGLFYSDELPAYPCLGFFQLNNLATLYGLRIIEEDR